MNIIIGKEDAEKMKDKYTVLPLETMKWKSNPDLPATTAYCLIENIPITEMKIESKYRCNNSTLRNSFDVYFFLTLI